MHVVEILLMKETEISLVLFMCRLMSRSGDEKVDDCAGHVISEANLFLLRVNQLPPNAWRPPLSPLTPLFSYTALLSFMLPLCLLRQSCPHLQPLCFFL